MKFAGRMNSFIHKGDKDIFQTIEAYKHVRGITHLEFNYPEHVVGHDLNRLVDAVGEMKVNGVATRFKNHFIAGEFTNPDNASAAMPYSCARRRPMPAVHWAETY